MLGILFAAEQPTTFARFKLMTSTNFTHVPYRGAAPAYSDVKSGQTPVFFDNLASALGQIKGGNAEAGVPGYDNYVWFGQWAPKKTPQCHRDSFAF